MNDGQRKGCTRPPTDDRLLRWVYRASVVVAVAPIVIAAVRKGLHHWEPTWDVATTAIRVRDVFSAHPPLIGFVAAPSVTASQPYSFPGALELYLLAVPVKVLGVTWGLLLGMAAINATFMVVALWLVRRRVGERGAILAAAFVASLLWSLGAAVIVSPAPVLMVTLPFFTLLVAAWSVADGDGPALLVLAFVGNYLVLDQLIFTLLVPALGTVALIYWIGFLRRSRHDDPDHWGRVRRAQTRWFSAAFAVTVLVWIPPLYEQLTHPGGNLARLLRAFVEGSGSETGFVAHKTIWGALSMVISVTAQHTLWLPPSFAHKPADLSGSGSHLWARVIAGLMLLAVVVALLRWMRVRRDRTMSRALVVAIVGWWGWMATAFLNPSQGFFKAKYFAGLWPLSAFLWFVILLGTVRLACPLGMRRRLAGSAALVAMGMAVVALAVAASSTADMCGAECAELKGEKAEIARDLRVTTADTMRGRGPVEVTKQDEMLPYRPSVLLGLQDAGVPFRVRRPFYVQLYGSSRDARIHRDARVRLAIAGAGDTPEGGRVVATFLPPRRLSSDRYDAIDQKMRRWAELLEKRAATPQSDPLPNRSRTANEVIRRLIDNARSHNGDLVTDQTFLRILEGTPKVLAVLEASGVQDTAVLTGVPGLSPSQVRDWAKDTLRGRYPGDVGLELSEVPPR